MKQLHQHISSICARCLLLLCFVFLYINTISANFELYILDNFDNVVTQSTFVNAGTNVADEMTTLLTIPSYTGNTTDYQFYIQNTNNLPDVKSDKVTLSSVMNTCSSGEIKLLIYANSTQSNYEPHNAVCMDTQVYTYGMVCWDNLTANCTNTPASASSHLFTGNNPTFSYTFEVNSISGGFKLLKSPDGTTWTWDAGQVGHVASNTILVAGTGVIINASNGNISLSIPGLVVGKTVSLQLDKTGSVYTLSATMLPDTPEVSNYSACQTPGTKTWASLVTATGTLVWYADATSTTPIAAPTSFDTNDPQTTSYWVAQESGGIESNRVQVTASVFAMPPANAAGEDRTICAGATTVLGVTSQPGFNYSWTPTLQLDVANIAQPTTVSLNADRTFTLTVSNQANATCFATSSVTVSIRQRPVITMDKTEVSICSGTTATFGNTNNLPNVSYEWSPTTSLQDPFDGRFVTTQPLTSNTTFTHTVQWNDIPYCPATATVNVNVVANPIANAGLDQNVCWGNVANIGSQATTGNTFTWSPMEWIDTTIPQNGFGKTARTKVMTQTVEFTLTAKTLFPLECTASDKVIVTVTPNPIAFSVTADKTEYCEGDDITDNIVRLEETEADVYYAIFKNGIKLDAFPWRQGDGSGMEWDGLESGIYTVRARKGNQSPYCTTTMNGTVTIVRKPRPTATITLLNSIACPGETANIKVEFTGTPPYFFKMEINGNEQDYYSTTNTYTLSHSLTGATTFKITEINSDGCSVTYDPGDEPTLVIDIDDVDDFEIIMTPNREKFCPGDVVTLSVVHNNPNSTYSWSTGETTRSIEVSYGADFKLTVRTEDGCQYIKQKEVVFGAQDELQVVGLKPIPTYCSSDGNVTLVGLPDGGAFSGVGIVGNDNIFRPSSVTQSTVGSITYTYSDGFCTKDTIIQNVIVNVPPQVDWEMIPDNAPFASSYNICIPPGEVAVVNLKGYPANTNGDWSLRTDDGSIPSQTTIQIVNKQEGTARLNNVAAGSYYIQYMIKDTYGCNSEKTKMLTVIDQKQGPLDFGVFDIRPNPMCINSTEAQIIGQRTDITYLGLSVPAMQVSQSDGFLYLNPSRGRIGNHSVIAQRIDVNGCVAKQRVPFQIVAPTRVFPFNIAKTYCTYDEDVQLVVNSASPTTGTISIDNITDPLHPVNVLSTLDPASGNVYFQPGWGAGKYEIRYEYTDGNCDNIQRDTVDVYAPSVIDMNLKSDYCIKEVINLASTPLGGVYSSDAVANALVNNRFYTERAGLGLHKIRYIQTNDHGCVSKDSTTIQVRGASVLTIADLKDQYCEPKGTVNISGFPNNPADGSVWFTGPTFLTSLPNGYASIDLSQATYNANYNVSYHYQENYVNAQGTPESCTTTVTKGFRVLNEAADFWGYNHMDVICGTQDSVVITGNKAPLGRFVFTGPAANFKDRGNGTAVIYPPTLSVGYYQVTYHYEHKIAGVTVCATEQAKTFEIAQIAPIEDISVFCSSGDNAIRIPNTEIGVEYELQVNGVTFEEKMGTGSILEFAPITVDVAQIKVFARLGQCVIKASQEFTVRKLALTTTKTDITCHGANDGKMLSTISGGGYPYSYSFEKIIGTPVMPTLFDSVAVNLTPGTYRFTVTDTIGCELQRQIAIIEPQLLSAIVESESVKCPTTRLGNARVIPTGGRTPYTYKWYKLPSTEVYSTAASISNLTSGTYRVEVFDRSGCKVERFATISTPEPIKIDVTKLTHVVITGANTGEIELNVTGGTPPYQYYWAGVGINPANVTNLNQYNLIAGNYQFTVTDDFGCKKDTVITITQPEVIQVQSFIKHVSCFGRNDALIQLTITGGVRPFTYSWTGPNGFTSSDEDIQNLAPGEYVFSLEDSNGNVFGPGSYFVNEPDLLEMHTLNTSLLAVSCHGDKTANIDVEVLGGTTPYNYTWTGPDVPSTITNPTSLVNLGAGTYQVQVRDKNNCITNLSAIIISPAKLNLAHTLVDNKCHNESAASITLTPSGGTPRIAPDEPYLFSWTGVGANPYDQNQTNLTAGETYTVTVHDANYCEVTKEFKLQNPTELVIDVVTTPISCAGRHDGSITVNVQGGVPTYSVEIRKDDNTVIINGSSANTLYSGTYIITVIDALGCEKTTSATLAPKDPLTVSITKQDVLCHGANSGMALATPSGGTQPYSYNWTKQPSNEFVSISNAISNLTPGNYKVDVSDFNDCTANATITIVEATPIVVGVTKQDVLVYDQATGSITLDVTGGTGSYTYEWLYGPSIDATNVANQNLVDIKAGNYAVRVRDANNCFKDVEISISQPEMLEVVATIQHVSCFGGSNGYIGLTISKGVAPYQVEWTYPNGSIVLTKNISNLETGLYKVVVTDARGHRFESEYFISQPDLLEVENLISSRLDIRCFGEKTGVLDIRVTGGTTPYSIQWTGPDVPTVVTNPLSVQSLGAGTYTVYIEDANGCRVQSTQTINQPTRLQVQAVVTNSTCYDHANGSIDLTVSGGVPSYSFGWTGIGVVPGAEDQTDLATGDYAVRVMDSNFCFVERQFSISSPTELLIDVEQVNVSCYGKRDGLLHARVSGGSYPYQHRWTYENGTVVQDSIILALYPGKYTYTLTDASGCTVVSDEYEITQPGPLQVSISGSSVLCQGVDDGVLFAEARMGTPGYSFKWTRLSPNTPFGEGPQLTNLGTGWYRVQVTDKNQCTATDEKEIKYSPIMHIQLVEKQNVLVTGESTGVIELDVQGGTPALTYSWRGGNLPTPSPNSLRVENLIAGMYRFTVQDGLGCSIDTTITITQPEIIAVTAVTKNIACHGESNGYIELNVTGGFPPYDYTWTSPSNPSFSSGDKNLYSLSAGSYSLLLEDQAGNRFTQTYDILQPTMPLVLNELPSSRTAISCNGRKDGYLNIEVNGGTRPYTLVWAGPDVPTTMANPFSLMNLGAGTYTLEVTDAQGCKINYIREITEPTPLVVSSSVTQNVCYNDANGSIELTVSGGSDPYTFNWSGAGVVNDAQNQTGLRGGQRYTVVVTDDNGCRENRTFDLVQPSQLSATITASQDICNGDEVTVYFSANGTPNWDYQYTDGTTVFTHTATQPSFTLTHQPTVDVLYELVNVTDGKGCQAQLQGIAPVKVHPYPQLSVLNVSNNACLGEPFMIDIVMANGAPWSVKYTDGLNVYVEDNLTQIRDTLRVVPKHTGTNTYTIQSISTEHCTTDLNIDVNMEVFQYPNLVVNAPSFVCANDTLKMRLEATGEGPWQVIYYENGVKHFLDFDEAIYTLKTIPTEENTVYLFESISSGNTCSTILQKQVTVSVGFPPSDATQITGFSDVCRNTSERYVVPVIPRATSYVWTFPQGYTITSGHGSNIVTVDIGADAVEGTATVYGINECGNGQPASIYIRPNTSFGPLSDIQAPVYVCENASLFQMSIPEVTGATSYEWKLPAGYTIESGANSRTILVSIDEYAQSGIVEVAAINRCGKSETKNRFITIRPLPIAEAGVDFTTNCVDNAIMKANNLAGAVTRWTLVSGRAEFDDDTKYNARVSNLLFGKNKFRWDVNDGYCLNFDTVAVYNNNPGITQPEFLDITICEDSITLRAPQPPFGNYRWSIIGGDGVVVNPASNSTLVTDLGYRIPNLFRWEVYSPSCSNTVDVKVISNSLHKLADAGEDDLTVNEYARISARVIADTNITGKWSVQGGTGTFDNSNAANTFVRGLAPGINTMRWTLRGYGCTAYDEMQLRYAEEPIADFEPDVISGCSPLTVGFANTTIGQATYNWDFGDGKTSTQRSPEHTFERSGLYEVTLTAVGLRKTDKITKLIEVLPSPKAAFLVANTELFMPYPMANFYSNTPEAIKYWWRFGDGATSTEKDPTHLYQLEGIYDVWFKVEDEKGCQDSIMVYNHIHVGDYGMMVFPNAFTPNTSIPNGGVYQAEERRLDIFYPVSRNVDTYKLEIFNQWGAKVFVSNDIFVGWDGYYKGESAPQGVYMYKATGTYKNGRKFTVSGEFILVR